MCFRKRADSHQRSCDRNPVPLREPAQLFRRPGGDDAAAGINARTPGPGDRPLDGGDLFGTDRLPGVFPSGRHSRVEMKFRNGFLNIFGNVDPDRPGPAAAGQRERRDDRRADFSRVEHQITVLDDRPGHADDIGLLEGVLADQAGFHLAGDDHHRHGIHPGIGDAGQQIGRARSAGRHADADFSRRPGITAGGERAALFMARQNNPDGRIGQRLVKFDGRAAGIGETEFDAEPPQRFDGNLRPAQQLHRVFG